MITASQTPFLLWPASECFILRNSNITRCVPGNFGQFCGHCQWNVSGNSELLRIEESWPQPGSSSDPVCSLMFWFSWWWRPSWNHELCKQKCSPTSSLHKYCVYCKKKKRNRDADAPKSPLWGNEAHYLMDLPYTSKSLYFPNLCYRPCLYFL